MNLDLGWAVLHDGAKGLAQNAFALVLLRGEEDHIRWLLKTTFDEEDQSAGAFAKVAVGEDDDGAEALLLALFEIVKEIVEPPLTVRSQEVRKASVEPIVAMARLRLAHPFKDFLTCGRELDLLVALGRAAPLEHEAPELIAPWLRRIRRRWLRTRLGRGRRVRLVHASILQCQPT